MTDQPIPASQSSASQAEPSPAAASASSAESQRTPIGTRPEYLPELAWDPTANAPRADVIKSAFDIHAAHEARVKARPENPDGYKLELPADFKPEIAIKIDEKDPRIADVRAFAHEHNLDQTQFSRLLQIEATRVQNEEKAYTEFKAAEQKKLGATAEARVTAVRTWLTGILDGKEALSSQVIDRMVYASDIELLEKLQLAFIGQGGSSFNNNGRDNDPKPPATTIEQRWYGAPQKAS